MELPSQIVALVIFKTGGVVLITVAATEVRLLSQRVVGSNTLTKKFVVVAMDGVVNAAPVNNSVVDDSSAYQRYTCAPVAPDVAVNTSVPVLHRLAPVATGGVGGVQANTVKGCVSIGLQIPFASCTRMLS